MQGEEEEGEKKGERGRGIKIAGRLSEGGGRGGIIIKIRSPYMGTEKRGNVSVVMSQLNFSTHFLLQAHQLLLPVFTTLESPWWRNGCGLGTKQNGNCTPWTKPSCRSAAVEKLALMLLNAAMPSLPRGTPHSMLPV